MLKNSYVHNCLLHTRTREYMNKNIEAESVQMNKWITIIGLTIFANFGRKNGVFAKNNGSIFLKRKIVFWVKLANPPPL
jgi:hypothetical protein